MLTASIRPTHRFYSTLPDDIWLLIFDRLNHQDKLNASLVCWRFARLIRYIPSLWNLSDAVDVIPTLMSQNGITMINRMTDKANYKKLAPKINDLLINHKLNAELKYLLGVSMQQTRNNIIKQSKKKINAGTCPINFVLFLGLS